MAPSPPPTGLLHQNSSTSVLGALPSRLVTEDTPPDMLAGSMDLRVTLPNGQTVKMSVERSTPMMDLLVHITTAHKVSPGGHVLQAMGERGVLPYKPSTPIGALDTWSIRVVPRHQIINTPQQQQQGLGVNKRAPPKPLALQPTQPFEQTFRLQVRLPRNQLYVSRISPRTSLAEILAQVCRDKNLDSSKYELRHPVNTEQSLQLSLTLADYRVTEVALVVRGSRAATELSSSDLPALQSRSDEPTSGDVRTQRASNSGSTASTGSATGIFGAMLKRSRSGGTTEGSLSGDSLGGRSSSPARSDESLSRSISPPASRPPGQTTSQMQPPPPPRHRKGRAPKPPPQAAVSVNNVNNKDGASGDQGEDRTLVISHSRNSSDSSGYHEASVLSESPENHARHPDSPSNTLNREKKSGSKAAKSQAKQFSRSMTNIPSEASTSNSKQSPALQKISNTHSISTTSLAGKKKRAPAPPPPRIPETQPSSVSHPEREETAVVALPSSNSVLEKARPNPAPRTHTKLAPTIPQSSEQKHEIKREPPPVRPRATKTKSSSELYKKSSSIKGLVKKTDKRNKSVDSMTGSLKSDKKQSSIGSSSSSVFGVGKSLLSLGSSQDIATDSDVDDLDLTMFESASYGEDDDKRQEQGDEMTAEEEAAAFENFHSALSSKKRNSITQIINKSKPPTPKAQRPIGYRVRPKLENIHWKTMDESNVHENESNGINRQSVSSYFEDGVEKTEGVLRRWSNSKALNTNQHTLEAFTGSGDGSDSDQDSTEERSLLTNGHDCVEEDDSLGEEELDSAFQSVTDVLEEQIRTEAAASKIFNDQEKIVQEDIAAAMDEEKKILKQKEEEDAKLVQAEEEARLMQEEENFRLEEEARLRQEQDYRIALEEQIRNEKLLRAEAERREAELERKRIEEERARLAEEREELARQRREQRELEKQLRERLEQELREKQQALQEEQRREIERLQKEQEELEKELREKEKEKAERLRVNQPPQQPHVIEEIVDWEYKLPAPPSAFRDTQVDVEISDNNIESAGLERRISSGSSSSELQNEVETKNKLNAMIETEDYIDNDVEIRPKPPEVVELRVKKSVTSEAQQRSLSPPRVSVVPLRSAHSLYSLVHMEDETTNKSSTESVQPMRKTSSVADVSSSSDDEARLQHLQQQFVQWQQQLITNQSVLQGHVSMPLQSLQVLREILPQMKQKLSEESNESNAETIIRSSTLPRPQRTAEISTEPTPSVAATLDRRSAPIATPVQRFRPPTVNLGTWSERPKSEVSIKQDSDYRIGVGQHQYTAARAPVVRSAEPKLKDTTNLIAGGAINRDVVARSNSWRSAPIQSSNKSSMVIIQNMNSANATEQVRASNKPTVILRHQPISLTDMQPQRRYTTLIGVNGAPQPAAKSNGYQQRTSTSITQATNPVVKGFKLLMDQTPAPPPPPPVIRNITQKRSSSSMPTNDGPDTRDRLMDAIRSFGGRSNLRKIGSPNNLIYQS